MYDILDKSETYNIIGNILHKISNCKTASAALILLASFIMPLALQADEKNGVAIAFGPALPFDNYASVHGGAAESGYIAQLAYSRSLEHAFGYSIRFAQIANGTNIHRQVTRFSDRYPSPGVDVTTGPWITNALVVGPTFSKKWNRMQLNAHASIGYSAVVSPSVDVVAQDGSNDYSLTLDRAGDLPWILSLGGEVRYSIWSRLALVLGIDFWYSEPEFGSVSATETLPDGSARRSFIEFTQTITVISFPIGIEIRF